MIPITNLTGRLGNQMFQFAYIFAQMKKGLIPDVYVQDEKYFSEFKDYILAMYRDGIGFTDYVSIHVRRGKNPYLASEPEYSENPFYVNLFNDGYYERAMALFPNEQFIVFSDDIPWCKEQKIFKGCAFSEGNNEVEDLNMMASCKSNIIANSSFSWWAAYLNMNPLKKVVAPKRWFSDGSARVGIPDNWIKI